MSEIPELSELQCVNGGYLDIFGNTIMSRERWWEIATFAEIAAMKVAEKVGPPPKREAAKVPVVVGKPTLSRRELKAMTPAAQMEAATSGKYEFVD